MSISTFHETYKEQFHECVWEANTNNLQGPDFHGHVGLHKTLYQMAEHYQGGGQADVFKVELAEDRPNSNVKSGDIIAVRVSCLDDGSWKWKYEQSSLRNLVRCSQLRSATPYFPEFYGSYIGYIMPYPPLKGKTAYSMAAKDLAPGTRFSYEEMTFVEKTFAVFDGHKDDKGSNKMSNSVVFEYLLGEWASCFYLGITIGDRKSRNYGLKEVPYSRCYAFGAIQYLFPPSQMPVRLDLSDSWAPKQQRFCSVVFGEEYAHTENAKGLLNSLFKNRSDLFTLFEKYFADYRVSAENPISDDAEIQYFTVPQEHIEEERSLPNASTS